MPLRRMIAIVREARQRFYREKQGDRLIPGDPLFFY